MDRESIAILLSREFVGSPASLMDQFFALGASTSSSSTEQLVFPISDENVDGGSAVQPAVHLCSIVLSGLHAFLSRNRKLKKSNKKCSTKIAIQKLKKTPSWFFEGQNGTPIRPYMET